MRFTLSVFVALAVATGIAVAAEATDPSKVQHAFDEAGITAKLSIKDFKPTALLQLSFSGSQQKSQSSVLLDHTGVEIPEKDASNQPNFCLPASGKPTGNTSSNTSFVIAMIDLGAEKQDPSPVPIFLGFDFKFEDDCLANNTPAVTEYTPPKPLEGSPHQVATLVYNQPEGFSKTNVATPAGANFNVSKFAEDNCLGSPVAATFMAITN